jgi:hypothetical protein
VETPVAAVALTRALATWYAAETRGDGPVLERPATDVLSLQGQSVSLSSARDVFRALHFAGGLPIGTTQGSASVATVIGLYGGRMNTQATGQIRLASIEALMPSAARAVDARAVSLALEGLGDDGNPRQTRVTCLARMLEIGAPNFCTPGEYDDPARIFGGNERIAEKGLRDESQYLHSHGIDLAAHEVRVFLRAGDLILIDNLRCASGFIGRPPETAWFECLIGSNAISANDVRAIRTWWGARMGGLRQRIAAAAT